MGAHGRVNPVGTHDNVGFDRCMFIELNRNLAVILAQGRNLVVQMQPSGGQRIEHSLVKSPTQKSDKPAAVLSLNLRR